MKELFIKTILPALTTLAVTIGAFNFRVEYTTAKTQEAIGKLVVTLSKECTK